MNTSDGPTLTVPEMADETRDELWTLRRSQPVGQSMPDYVPPARWVLPSLKDSVQEWKVALEIARQEIPSDLARTAEQLMRQHRDGWQQTAERSPEIRRLLTVACVLTLREAAVEDLENEGKPTISDLTLTKHRQR